jgi:hypothetical protein
VKKIQKFLLGIFKPKNEINSLKKLGVESFNSIKRDYLLENIHIHKSCSEVINSYFPWGNYFFDPELGSMGFSNNTQGFLLALDKNGITQAKAMFTLNREFAIRVNVANDGSITVNLKSIEFFQSFACSGIKSFKIEQPQLFS